MGLKLVWIILDLEKGIKKYSEMHFLKPSALEKDKVEIFLQQVKKYLYYNCTICHRRLYRCSVKIFKDEKNQIFTSLLYHSVKSPNKKSTYIKYVIKHYIKQSEIKWIYSLHQMSEKILRNQKTS